MLFEPKYIKQLQQLAEEHHKDQMYGDEPYMVHINEVVKETKDILSARDMDYDEDYWVYVGVAIGHDLVEDTEVTLFSLLDLGIPVTVVNSISHITNDSTCKAAYIDRVKENTFSHLVKQADSLCNLTRSIRDGNSRRIKKYTNYLNLLSE